MHKKVANVLILIITILVCFGMYWVVGANNPPEQQTELVSDETMGELKELGTEQGECVRVTYPITTDTKLTAWMARNKSIGKYNTKLEMPAYTNIKKQIGIEVAFTMLPADTPNVDLEFQMLLMGGNIPDLVQYLGFEGNTKYVEDGYFMDLAPLIEQYAYHFNELRKNDPEYELFYQTLLEKGAIITFPQAQRKESDLTKIYSNIGLYLRADWLAELGLEVPKTMEELTLVLTTIMREKNLDTGLITSNQYLSRLASCYGTYYDLYQDNGIVKFGPYTQEWKQYLIMMNKWYETGILGSKFVNPQAKEISAMLLGGKVAGTIGWLSGGLGETLAEAKKEQSVEESFDLIAIPYPVLECGKVNEYGIIIDRFGGRASGTWAISKTCKNPEAAIRWLDYFYSEEGMYTRGFGIEGESYTIDGGEAYYTEEMRKDPNYTFQQMIELYTDGYWPGPGNLYCAIKELNNANQQQVAMEEWGKAASQEHAVGYLPMTKEDSYIVAQIRSEILSYTEEMAILFISGARPVEEYDEYIQELKDMEIETMLKLCQKAYDQCERVQ